MTTFPELQSSELHIMPDIRIHTCRVFNAFSSQASTFWLVTNQRDSLLRDSLLSLLSCLDKGLLLIKFFVFLDDSPADQELRLYRFICICDGPWTGFASSLLASSLLASVSKTPCSAGPMCPPSAILLCVFYRHFRVPISLLLLALLHWLSLMLLNLYKLHYCLSITHHLL